MGLFLNEFAILAAVAGVSVFALLYSLAARLDWERRLHNLRVEAHTLRIVHERRLAAIRAGELAEINVDIVEDPDPADNPAAEAPTAAPEAQQAA